MEDTYYLWRIIYLLPVEDNILITCGGYLLPVEDTYYLWRILITCGGYLLPVEDNILITCGG